MLTLCPQQPISDGVGNWPWCGHEEGGLGEGKYRYSLTSLSHPRRCVGFTRRRIGRGGRYCVNPHIFSMSNRTYLWLSET